MDTSTCIVGLKVGPDIYIAGDSAGSNGYTQATYRDEKVFRKGDFLYGYTSSYRMGQLLRYAFEEPELGDKSIDRYMRTEYMDEWRSVLEERGWLRKKNEREKGGTFLVGLRGRLFVVQNDLAVLEPAYPYYAVGCGEKIAVGALHAIYNENENPDYLLSRALRAAQEFSNGVRGPFRCVDTNTDHVRTLS